MTYSLMATIVFILDVIAIFSLLMGYGSAGHKLFWILMILFLPLVGMILYYVFGRSPVDA